MASAIARREPIFTVTKPLRFRIQCFLLLWTFKIAVATLLGLFRLRGRSGSPKKPTYIKTYPVRPRLKTRVFIPSSFKDGDKKLPLYIDVHGGGFAILDAEIDDRENWDFAEKYGMCVVSLDYSLAPQNPFPVAVHDVAALTKAVLDDDELPCDKSKVAIGGYSAGGNLALTAVQLDGLHSRIGAVVAYYPVTDFTKTVQEKLKTRPEVPGQPDTLRRTAVWFNWGYLPVGTDLTNPLLSPTFADRTSLPPSICLIGCEYDLLCKEAEDLALRLAESEEGALKMFTKGEGWEKGHIRWEKVLGQKHGFNGIPPGKGEAEVVRMKAAEEMHTRMTEWLFRQVYT